MLTAVEFEFDVDEPCEHAAPGAIDSCSPGVDSVPVMPVRSETFEHRAPESTVFFYSACVARPVDRKERAANPKAKAALDKEWDKLIRQGCWDYSSVREWREVSNEAIPKGETAHVGRIFDICVEKNSELPESDPNRKFKGRVVFEGCHVKDEGNNWAIFSEITSCPATMEAGKAADAFGCCLAMKFRSQMESLRILKPSWADLRHGYDCPKSAGCLSGMVSTMTRSSALFLLSMVILMLVVSGNNTARKPCHLWVLSNAQIGRACLGIRS